MSEKSEWMDLKTCVSPEGRFVFGLHEPHFRVTNLRPEDFILSLGDVENGEHRMNHSNFPPEDVEEKAADAIFEVANPFPFRGTTYIGKRWADRVARDPSRIAIAPPQKVSLGRSLKNQLGLTTTAVENLLAHLPEPLQLALATTSTDPQDLKILAKNSCKMIFDKTSGLPTGLRYAKDAGGRHQARILNDPLFEAVANNPYLDDSYKQVMVLRPGVQGESEIVGQWRQSRSHVFEYLRRNSYIPWGHYAANMAHDAVRYAVGDLLPEDIFGMRHLYYQRSIVRMADAVALSLPSRSNTLSPQTLEQLRMRVVETIKGVDDLPYSATLWGWNYGFDYAPSRYRLHASHQQIHQQYALIPTKVRLSGSGREYMPAFACGDMIQTFVQQYRKRTGRSFFNCYEQAIRTNKRMDGPSSHSSDLVVYEDKQVMLFAPKSQTSQWELQLMPRSGVGNILEANLAMRQSLDKAILVAMRILTGMGATMISVIEYSKRFLINDEDQRLLYCFLPKVPESPGAFSEAQLRWINGHYPEDFAAACRLKLEQATKDLETLLI